ncbi:MAG: SRPBCC family protein [Alphaproteobacteria bacterium]|nr:SRPBCC family protein [Alphaproteobacteria bacterium]MCW5744474.1 SRPBCC family protein [Alphaproteobacteria bacterium]
MSEYGVVLDAGTIRFERLLPGPIERVWEFLTDPVQRAKWFAGGPIEPRVGGRLELRFKHRNLMTTDEPVPEKYRDVTDKGMIFRSEVTRWEPPRVLGFTFSEPKDGVPPSEVIFELTSEGDKVRLVLTHRLLSGRDEMADVSGGWHLHLEMLTARLEGRTPPQMWATHAKLEQAYAERLPR